MTPATLGAEYTKFDNGLLAKIMIESVAKVCASVGGSRPVQIAIPA